MQKLEGNAKDRKVALQLKEWWFERDNAKEGITSRGSSLSPESYQYADPENYGSLDPERMPLEHKWRFAAFSHEGHG
ncbi:hypothetical protein BFW01_g6976 [Lasiodiplodia theobromae]|nr:hypothetical protein BFW01_g6976 [Lasiodiplodia theobromae]